MPFTSLASNTSVALSALAGAVNGIHPTEVRDFEFRTSDLIPGEEPKALIQQVGDWTTGHERFIYVMRMQADEKTLTDLRASFIDAKESKLGARAYPRLFKANSVLYVGSSADLRSRFRQHLGYASRSVSALQLVHWASGFDVPVTMNVARYANDLDVAVLGALEDQLWSELRPMLGRQGRR